MLASVLQAASACEPPLATAVSHGKLESALLLAIAGAAPRYGAVDLVDEAHARNLPALRASPTYCLDTVRTSLPLVRLVASLEAS